MCFHKWNKWSEPMAMISKEKVEYDPRTGQSYLSRVTDVFVQTRSCAKCNKAEFEEVYGGRFPGKDDK